MLPLLTRWCERKLYLSTLKRRILVANKSFAACSDILHEPGHVTPPQNVSDDIQKPLYASPTQTKSILNFLHNQLKKSETKSDELVAKIEKSCRIGRYVLNRVRQIIKPGISTDDIDFIVHKLICEQKAYPSPLGYNGFPKSVCTSVNNVVVHGIPDSRELKSGDIVNVDVSVFFDGAHGDLSETFLVGDVDQAGRSLVDITKKCLNAAISICKPGQHFNAIGQTVSSIASKHGFSVCPHFVGHGIGEQFHESLQILHHYNTFGGIMKKGMVFTIEPVLCEGSPDIKHWRDGWTVITADQKRAAQFEHTVLITTNGAKVLTQDQPDDVYLNPGVEERKKLELMIPRPLDEFR